MRMNDGLCDSKRNRSGKSWDLRIRVTEGRKKERKKESKQGRKMGPLSRRLPGNNRASAVTVLMAFYKYGMGWDGQLRR